MKLSELVNTIKGDLKELVGEDTTLNDKLISIDKKLDGLLEETDKKDKELVSVKDKLIESIKASAFKPTGEEDNLNPHDNKEVSMEEIANDYFKNANK